MAFVEIIETSDGEFYDSEHVCGSTINVVIMRTNDDGSVEYARCDGMLYMEEEDDETLSLIFDEWVAFAAQGEKGYKHWVE